MAIENVLIISSRLPNQSLKEKLNQLELPTKLTTTGLQLFKRIEKSVFGTPFGGCVSWYSDAKVNSTVYPWSQFHYWWITHFPNYKDLVYEPLNEDKKRR